MKVAITHDYLNQFGGAERVLAVLLEMFPEADLYSLLYEKEATGGLFEDNIKGTSFLDFKVARDNHRFFIPLMPLGAEMISSSEDYDLILSSTAGYGKGIGIEGDYHISYCHTPLRYAWEIDYLKELPNSPWPLSKFIAKPIAEVLRRWDKKASQEVNLFVTNSNFISKKVKSYYGRDSMVVYPPVDVSVFYPDKGSLKLSGDYYLMVGRLIYYKLFDLGVEVFNELGKPLKIVGSGPQKSKLQKKAGSNIEFISGISDERLRALYSGAKGLIFPQVEDFGLVAAEAQACGLPVVGFNKGGAREIVEENKTGVLFDHQNVESIKKAVKKLESIDFDRRYIARRAEKFSKESFKENMREVIRQAGFDPESSESVQ